MRTKEQVQEDIAKLEQELKEIEEGPECLIDSVWEAPFGLQYAVLACDADDKGAKFILLGLGNDPNRWTDPKTETELRAYLKANGWECVYTKVRLRLSIYE